MDAKFTREYIELLAYKYESDKLTDQERDEYDQWLSTQANGEFEHTGAKEPWVVKRRVLRRVLEGIREKGLPMMKDASWFSIAASVILISTIGLYLYMHKQGDSVTVKATSQQKIDIAPGSDKAVLTLADGRTINLTDAGNGDIAALQGVKISKTKEGQLVYHITGRNGGGSQAESMSNTNTIATPAGGQYQVILPDGSQVFLNAASSLTYPVQFSKSERRVELSGEAYFEIALSKNQPFKVISGKQEVEVLGTRFNINCYADESAMATTLEEGSVRVTINKQSRTIIPGQQTLMMSDGQMKVKEADLESALAWKNGRIYFNQADIPTIMRQVARWYDVKIRYEGVVTGDSFTGGVSRSSSLESLLKILRLNKINFKLEEKEGVRTLVVMH
jgi:ferric-dicitrate binding protein FerR (iron transport regulator)